MDVCYILMALFGGGILDWQDIAKTEYDWNDIFDRVYYDGWTLNKIDINDLYVTILKIAVDDFGEKMKEFLDSHKDVKYDCLRDINFYDYDNYDMFCNYLDTHLTLMVDKEVADILREDEEVSEIIEEVNNNIGFTYIGYSN